MAFGLLSHRLYPQQKVVKCKLMVVNMLNMDFDCVRTILNFPLSRGFDTFFGEYAQQADHYTRFSSQMSLYHALIRTHHDDHIQGARNQLSHWLWLRSLAR